MKNKLTSEELKELVFEQNQATKQYKDKLFKLSKANDDMETIKRLRDVLGFKSAKIYLEKLENSSIKDAIKNRDLVLLKIAVSKNVDASDINIADLIEKNYSFDFIKILLDNNAKIDQKSKEGLTALMIATLKENYDLVNNLLKFGANADIIGPSNGIVLMMAAERQNEEIALLLLQHTTKIDLKNSINKESPLYYATRYNMKNLTTSLINLGADINTKNIKKTTALFSAAFEGHESIVKLLIEKGADINIQNNEGATALVGAVYGGHKNIVDILIANGANIMNIDKFGRDIIQIALAGNIKYSILKLLLDNGAPKLEKTRNQKPKELEHIHNLEYEKRQKFAATIPILFKKFNKKIHSKTIAEQFILCIFSMLEPVPAFNDLIKDNNLNIESNPDYLQEVDEVTNYFLDMEENIEVGAKVYFTEAMLDMLLQEYLLGKYSLDEYKEIVYNKYDEAYKYKLILKDQIDGKAIIDVFKHKLIFHFENVIDNRRTSTEYKLVDTNTYYDQKLGHIFIIDNKVIEKTKAGLRVSEFIKKDEFDNIIVDNRHNPKKLVEILNLFTEDNPIKYTAHSFEWSKYGSYVNFMKEVQKAFTKVEDDLTILSPNLHIKINKFLFDDNLDENNTWGMFKMDFGWSSPELKEWCSREDSKVNGKKAINFSLPKQYQKEIGDKTLVSFENVCSVLKNEIEIRDDDKLKMLFATIKKDVLKFDFEVRYKNLENISFYTDVENFKNGLTLIFEQFKEDGREQHDTIEIEAIPDENKKYVDIRILQIGSTVGKKSTEMQNEIEDGTFIDIKNYFSSLCDWSIEASFGNGDFRINYLSSDDNSKEPIPPEKKPLGFTHVLRFYK